MAIGFVSAGFPHLVGASFLTGLADASAISSGDAHIEKIMGIIAIGDPVFNLSVRDAHIGWECQ